MVLSVVYAQKGMIAYVDVDSVVALLPEFQTAREKLQKYAMELQETFNQMVDEYNKKLREFQEKGDQMSELKRNMLAEDIANLEKKIQEFQTKGQQEVQKKQIELLQPLIENAKKIIIEVAKSQGYKYVLEKGVVIYAPEGDDIFPLVKKRIEAMKQEAEKNKDKGGSEVGGSESKSGSSSSQGGSKKQ